LRVAPAPKPMIRNMNHRWTESRKASRAEWYRAFIRQDTRSPSVKVVEGVDPDVAFRAFPAVDLAGAACPSRAVEVSPDWVPRVTAARVEVSASGGPLALSLPPMGTNPQNPGSFSPQSTRSERAPQLISIKGRLQDHLLPNNPIKSRHSYG
jgi:hypothetical protein